MRSGEQRWDVMTQLLFQSLWLILFWARLSGGKLLSSGDHFRLRTNAGVHREDHLSIHALLSSWFIRS